MGLVNLSLVEFLAIFLPVAAGIVALYLYDRSRRRQVVSTLRFFPQAAQAPVFVRRKKIQQPWSLLLQLVSLALLLLAIADLEFGRPADRARDHVLILETSAWMNAAAPGDARATLMQVARRRALDYLRAVPAPDRVLLVRADALATPVTTFTKDRTEIEKAIRASEAGSTALNLSGALEFARSAQKLSAARPGEIVVVGSGRVVSADLDRVPEGNYGSVRAILLGGEPNDCGIRKLSARRAAVDPFEWEIDVGAYNYGAAEHTHRLRLTFAGRQVAARSLTLSPRSAAEAGLRFRSVEAGLLEAVLDSNDDYRADNRAAIELSALAPLKIQVFTNQPARWLPLVTASRFLNPEFRSPGQYSPTGEPRRLVILDGFSPSAAPDADAIWIMPADALAPGKIHVRRWNDAHPVAAGLHNKDVRVSRAAVLKPAPNEVVLAESEAGPVLLAHAASHKKIVFGFHPLEEGIDNHLAVPLLFANLVRWVSPELFRLAEIRAVHPGLVELKTPPGTLREQIQVASAQAAQLPFTLTENRLRFFAGRAGTVRVALPEREVVYSLTLPEVGEARWTPPSEVRRGVPPQVPSAPANPSLWRWLALAGALGLLLEWMLYGRHPVAAVPSRSRSSAGEVTGAPSASPEPQEVRP